MFAFGKPTCIVTVAFLFISLIEACDSTLDPLGTSAGTSLWYFVAPVAFPSDAAQYVPVSLLLNHQ